MLVSLSLGAIGVGIYIANFRSKPENRNRNFSVATVSLIMVTSMLVGLLAFGVYYGLTYENVMTCEEVQAKYSNCNPVCPTCIWGPKDVHDLRKAEGTVHNLQRKARGIPRNLKIKAQCDDTTCAVGDKSCCGMDADDVVFGNMMEQVSIPRPAPPVEIK